MLDTSKNAARLATHKHTNTQTHKHTNTQTHKHLGLRPVN